MVKAAGALKVIVSAHAFGTGDAMDAFLIAFLLPASVAEVLAGSMVVALVPEFVKVRGASGDDGLREYAGEVLGPLLMMLAIAALLLAVAAPLLLRAVAAGFDAQKLALTRWLLFSMLPILPLAGCSVVARSMLNAREYFMSAALAPVATPVLTIALLWLAGRDPSAWVLAAGAVGGVVLEVLLLCAAVGWQLPKISLRVTPRMLALAREYMPLAVVTLLAAGKVLVDEFMAATLGPGSVSALDYGTRLTAVIVSIAGTALGTAALPHLARTASARDWKSLRGIVTFYGVGTVLCGAALSALLILFSPPLVRLVLQRGALGGDAAVLVTRVQQLSLLQLPVAVLQVLFIRLAASLEASWVLLPMSALGLVVNVAANYALMGPLGLPGIALSGLITQSVAVGAGVWLLRNRIVRTGT